MFLFLRFNLDQSCNWIGEAMDLAERAGITLAIGCNWIGEALECAANAGMSYFIGNFGSQK